jgi:hypothetical protein
MRNHPGSHWKPLEAIVGMPLAIIGSNPVLNLNAIS